MILASSFCFLFAVLVTQTHQQLTQTEVVNLIIQDLPGLPVTNRTPPQDFCNPPPSFWGCGVDGLITQMELISSAQEGTLATVIGLLTSLRSLRVRTFSSQFPTEIANLQQLTNLHWAVSDSFQTNLSLPRQIGLLSSLSNFEVVGRAMKGTFPTEIGMLASLTRIRISFTDISGAIPVQFGNLRNLSVINFDNTLLCGTIPDNVKAMIQTSTTLLGLSFNDHVYGICADDFTILAGGSCHSRWSCNCSSRCQTGCFLSPQAYCDTLGSYFVASGHPPQFLGNTAGDFNCSCLNGTEHTACGNRCTPIDMCERYGCKDGTCQPSGLNRRICSCPFNPIGTTLVGSQEFQGCFDIQYCGDNITNGLEECDGDRGCDNQTCTCLQGWGAVPNRSCVEICGDGIAVGDEECDQGQGCRNLYNSSEPCLCDRGFEQWEFPPIKHCRDIDECLDMETACVFGSCVNTLGSYFCDCTQVGLHLNATTPLNPRCQITNGCQTVGCGGSVGTNCSFIGLNNRSCQCPIGYTLVGAQYLQNNETFEGCEASAPFPFWIIVIVVVFSLIFIMGLIFFWFFRSSNYFLDEYPYSCS